MRRGLALLSIALVAAALAKAEDSAAAEESTGRVIAEHLFIPSEIVADPFVVSFARKTSGFGSAWVKQPTGTNVQAVLAPAVVGQWALLDWLAVRGFGSALVYVATDTQSALALGTTAQVQFGVGATASTLVSERLRLGVTLDAGYNPATTLTPEGPLVASARTGAVDTTGLFLSSHGVAFQPGLSGAFAISRLMGLVSTAQLVLPTEPTAGVGVDHPTFAIGAVTDFDLSTVSSLPLGFTAAYRLLVPFSGDTRLWHALDIGGFYVGRRTIVTGGEVSLRWYPRTPGVDVFAAFFNIVFRYYP